MNNTDLLQRISNTIRSLSLDAIDAANSGHPGLPLGCADIASVLFAKHLKHNPKDPNWIARDRFVLSAGHGSMLLYASLYLAGFDLSIDQIKNFRQIHSPTAGHPEYKHIPGIEVTTGPLGQGVGMAVGMALSQLMISQNFDTEKMGLFDSQIYCLCGDGDLMEGVASEAASLAGHLKCHNLTLIYDSNNICLDGSTDECFTEDVAKRFEAYGWQVHHIDGHDFEAIQHVLKLSKQQNNAPSLIVAKTTIGYGSPKLAGSSESHGKAFGEAETKATKETLGITWGAFEQPDDVKDYFKKRQNEQEIEYLNWKNTFIEWKTKHPKRAEELENALSGARLASTSQALENIDITKNVATRNQSGEVLQHIAASYPQFVGGSADLSCSDNTYLKDQGMIQAGKFTGKNFKFGVREFAMAAIVNGLALGKVYKAYCGTFLTFSDYMKNAIRLAAIMKLPVVYQFTHDSVFLGEDGPTHQPVEHLAALRAIPNLVVLRPADDQEVIGSWQYALTASLPVAIVFSRQKTVHLTHSCAKKTQLGAYIISESSAGETDILILSTGTEVALSLAVKEHLELLKLKVRVVSMPSWELFDQQPLDYKKKCLSDHKHSVVIEAQSSFGWHKYTGTETSMITVDTFGQSGTEADLRKELGFNAEAIAKKIQNKISLDLA